MKSLSRQFGRVGDSFGNSQDPLHAPLISGSLEEDISSKIRRGKSCLIANECYSMFVEDVLMDQEIETVGPRLFIDELVRGEPIDPNSLSRVFRKGNHLGPA